jgi:hypothetical protein
MRYFFSWMKYGRTGYALQLRYPYRIKSWAVKSGEHSGQRIDLEIKRPGKFSVRKVTLCLAVYGLLHHPVETIRFPPFASSFTVP